MKDGREYKVGESATWNWFGKTCWWEVFAVVDGWNGVGGYWVTEKWRWNSSREVVRTAVRTLSREESRALDRRAAKYLWIALREKHHANPYAPCPGPNHDAHLIPCEFSGKS